MLINHDPSVVILNMTEKLNKFVMKLLGRLLNIF